MKLQTKILLFLIPLVTLPLLTLGWIAYERLKELSSQLTFKQADTLLEQTELQTKNQLETIQASMELLSNSDLLKQYMLVENERTRYTLLQPSLLSLFASYQQAYPDFYEIRVLLPDGYEDTRFTLEDSVNVQEEEGQSSYFQEMTQSPHEIYSTVFQNPDNQEIAFLIAKKILLLNPATENPAADPTLQGYLAITVRLKFLENQIKSSQIEKEGFLFVTDDQGKVLFHPKQNQLLQTLPKAMFVPLLHSVKTGQTFQRTYQGKFVFLKAKRLHSKLLLISVLPEKALLEAGWNLGLIVITVTLISIFIISLLLFSILNYWMVRPIRELSHATQEIEKGNLDIRLNVNRNDEIGLLVSDFNHMAQAIKNAQEQTTAASACFWAAVVCS